MEQQQFFWEVLVFFVAQLIVVIYPPGKIINFLLNLSSSNECKMTNICLIEFLKSDVVFA